MKELETGMLARSKAGHDKGQIYIIKDMDENDVYLVNGENRTCDKPKKKKRKHVQIITERYEIQVADDVAVKRILKLYKEKNVNH